MGCDIHLYVETRNSETGEWGLFDPEKEKPSWWDEEDEDLYLMQFYSGRNYGLFGMLANVRNGYGFAGVDTGDGYKPIAEPKGLPGDVCAQIAADSERWGVDGHSHSHFTVAELLAYDWEGQTTTKRGVVNALEYLLWKQSDTPGPGQYSGSVFGGLVEHIGEEAMKCYLRTSHFRQLLEEEVRTWTEAVGRKGRENLREHDLERLKSRQKLLEEVLIDTQYNSGFDAEASYYTKASWDETYACAAGSFHSETLPALRALDENPENVRIVFWFDN